MLLQGFLADCLEECISLTWRSGTNAAADEASVPCFQSPCNALSHSCSNTCREEGIVAVISNFASSSIKTQQHEYL